MSFTVNLLCQSTESEHLLVSRPHGGMWRWWLVKETRSHSESCLRYQWESPSWRTLSVMRLPSQTPAVVILFKERWQTPAVLHDALPTFGHFRGAVQACRQGSTILPITVSWQQRYQTLLYLYEQARKGSSWRIITHQLFLENTLPPFRTQPSLPHSTLPSALNLPFHTQQHARLNNSKWVNVFHCIPINLLFIQQLCLLNNSMMKDTYLLLWKSRWVTSHYHLFEQDSVDNSCLTILQFLRLIKLAFLHDFIYLGYRLNRHRPNIQDCLPQFF